MATESLDAVSASIGRSQSDRQRNPLPLRISAFDRDIALAAAGVPVGGVAVSAIAIDAVR